MKKLLLITVIQLCFIFRGVSQNVVASSLNKDVFKERATSCILLVAVGSNKNDFKYTMKGMVHDMKNLRVDVKEQLFENGTEFKSREERIKESMKNTNAKIAIIITIMESKETNPLTALVAPLLFVLDNDKIRFQITVYNENMQEVWKGISKYKRQFPHAYFTEAMFKDGLL
jgi:hypothetical protein